MIEKAFEGTKVLEYSNLVSGPYCAKLLADLGADVIKIERPGFGDDARKRGPFLDDVPHHEKSGLFLYVNTNKRGITLDTGTETGRKIFLELIKWADILIEDKSPKEMEVNRLSYEILKDINPSLIMTSISPFGQTGPYKEYKAYHLNTSHSAGGGYMNPPASPNLEREPLKGASLMDDYVVSIFAATTAVGALYSRSQTGKGQHIDISKQEALMNIDRVEIDQYPNAGSIARRAPVSADVGGIGFSECKDGHVIAMAMGDRQWNGLVEAMGNPEWAKDERFKDDVSREEFAKELGELTSKELKKFTKEEIYHKGQAAGALVGMVMKIDEIINSEQTKARGFMIDIDHPQAGRISYPGSPYKLSETPWEIERPAPLLGQHNEEIYCKLLGYTKEKLVRLRETGII